MLTGTNMKSIRKHRQEFNGGFALVRIPADAQRKSGKAIRTGRRLLIQWFPAEKWKAPILKKHGGMGVGP
jgi:hypothetical protein